MKRLTVVLCIAALTSVALFSSISCSSNQTQQRPTDFKSTMETYVRKFLHRNPVVNTYLGGGGLNPALKEADGRLRDHSQSALDDEDKWLNNSLNAIQAIDANSLSSIERIDREVALSQIKFLQHQHQVRKYQQRSLDTYTDEPFRAIDWQLQGMTQTGDQKYGTNEEWSLVAKRVADIPRFLKTAQDQLQAGVQANNFPDWRELRRNGLDTSEANATYFEKTLPGMAEKWIAAADQSTLLPQIQQNCKTAADAYRTFRTFIAATFFDDPNVKTEAGLKPQFRGDHFAMGETEYDWALKNNLHVTKTAAQLYEESWPIVQGTRDQMIALAREIGKAHNWDLPADGPAAVRFVFDELSKDYPKSDAELIEWYRQTGVRLVEYARKTGMFDVPADYKLDVTETPPPLRAAIDGASYYPAPPFKNSGVGRFYVTTTDNDIAALKASNRASLADLAAHEGFPGHDWHYKVMTQYRDQISPVRWLTPGAVEDSSSMWEDSMAAEGWALYSEALMAEPQPGAPNGFYTPEEHLYQLQGKLYRDLRVRIDTGIHTGRMKYDEAVDLFSNTVDFEPGACGDPAAIKDEAKRASCNSAEKAIFRYSKWPTQAITYRLGRDEIFALRDETSKLLGDKFSPKAFHVLFMKQGTIPAGYFREEFLKQIQQQK